MDRIARLLIAGALLIAHAPAAAAPWAAAELVQRAHPDRAVIDRMIAPRTPPTAFPARAAVVPDDARWADEFGAPAFDRWPQAAIEFQGSLVVGGDFTRIGDVYCPGVMRWNGSTWVAMGEGPGGVVYAFAIVDGALVAAGSFLDPLSQQPIPLMRWNGSAWAPFGPFMRGTAYAITVDGSDVYLLGFLFYSGYANRVLRLNAGTWEPVGGAIDGDPRALTMWNGQLVLGGRFDSIGGVPIRSLAAWDGFNWNEIGGGLTGQAYELIMSLAVWQGDLIAGGYISDIGGQAISGVARWNGATWSALGAPLDGGVTTILSDGATLHVGGYLYGVAPYVTTVLSTDGATWSWTDEQPVNQVATLIHHGGELVAVGPFAEIVGPSLARRAFWVARRAGNAWQPVEAWSPAYEGFMGIYGPRMSALDEYLGVLLVGGPVQARAESSSWTRFDGIGTWDGTEWRGIGFGPAYTDPSFAVAGDTLELFGANGLEPVRQYDGAVWRELGDFDGWGSLDLERYAGRLHALGWMTLAGGTSGAYHLAQWTGSEWVIVDPGFEISGGISGYLSCMTVHDGKLYVAGDFEWVGNVPAHGIAAWDGTHWSAVGGGVSSVFTMRSHGDRLWVGGTFFRAGNVDAVGLANWDGQAWSDGGLTGGTTGVSALGDYDGALVAGGFTLAAGTQRFAGIAVRDGGWKPFGSGIEGWVYDIQQIGTSLYVAGNFATAGGKPSYGLARWDRGVPDRPAQPAQLRIATPNPFATGVDLAFTMPQEGWVVLTIHDLAGREVSRLREGTMGGGYQTVRWIPGRDGARPGVYVARLDAGGVVSTTKLVVLP